MRTVWIVITIFISGIASAQTPANDYWDSLGLARLKNYSSYRVSSNNRFVLSNDDSKRIMPGETLVMADLRGPGMVTHIWLTVAQNEFGWPRLLRLRVYYDGRKTPSVDAPLGDFFAVGHGAERNVQSLMVRDSSFGRARNSYWPMPFRKSCRITVTNEGNRFVPMFYYHVDYRKYASLPANIGYFHAYYRQERPARAGRNYEFLNIKGTGHYVGTVLSVIQTQISWFGEGDDLFYVDGAKHPQIYGTGSEDYFNEAWGLRDETGPWTGTPIAEGELPGSRLSAYRWHVPDPIAFTQSIWAGIEHSGWTANPNGTVRSSFEERPDYFSSVAFWYQKGVNEGLPEPPYGQARLPFGNASQIAVEDSINDITSESGRVSVQRDVDWAKDLLFFEAQGIGAKINIPFDVQENGRYEPVVEIAQAPDYGDYTALVDGKPTNVDTRLPATSEVPSPGPEVFHNYLSEVYVARDRTLGMMDLSTGHHTLTLICVGKDPRSAGYNLGVNELVLQRILDRDESENTSPTPGTEGAASGIVYRGRSLRSYVGQLKGASDAQQAYLIRIIGYFGADGTSAIEELVIALSDPSPVVRAAAADALSQVGPYAAATAVPALATALSDSNPRVRDLAAIGLKAIGPRAVTAVPTLVRALNDPADYVRAPAADALGAIGTGAREAVQPLAKRLLEEQRGFVLISIASALGNIGPAAKDALPALQQMSVKRRLGPAAQEAILKIEGRPIPQYY